MSFAGATRVHFIGVGGAGMSAIAKVLLERGVRISGSDLKGSRAMTVLAAMGADVHVGHDATHIEGTDLVVVSAAIPDTNPELAAARDRGITVMGRGEALAALLETHRSVIVAGTHGKTTTTSMIVSILRWTGVDPTFLVGGGLNDSGTNARSGSGDLAVAESDESDGSFLLLRPHVGVVTNIEMDHVDHWGSLEELNEAFDSFMASTDEDGVLVVPAGGDIEARARATGRNVWTFGDGGDVYAEETRTSDRATVFSLVSRGATSDVHLHALGAHNVANALAAAAAAIAVGMDPEDTAAGLATFRGVERRFDLKGTASGVTVVDDYAHHPTEVAVTLSAAQEGPWGRVIAVFQPHRYSRTAALHEAFGASFAHADRVIVTDVYGAGEEPVPGVSGKLISDAICSAAPGRGVAYLPHRADVLAYLRATTRDGDLVLTLGAGDVTSLGDELLLDLGGFVSVEAVADLLAGDLDGSKVIRDEPLARFTTYRLGGPAAIYVEPADESDAVKIGRALSKVVDPPPVIVVGRGSNLVISDDGWPGIAIRLGSAFSFVEPADGGLRAGGATALPLLANWAARRGLAGLEFTIAIPGSVGGAVRMNAGAHGSEIKDRLRTAAIYDLAGCNLGERPTDGFDFSYRHSNVSDTDIVLSAVFDLQEEDPRAVKERMESYRKHRAETQPGAVQNAGSVFRNPPGGHAGRLVEATGLKGLRIGGARVSELHANFFIAGDGSTAQDVFDLVREVKRRVFEAQGVDLTPEIRFVGAFRDQPGGMESR